MQLSSLWTPEKPGVPGKHFSVKAFFADRYLLGVLVNLKKYKFITMSSKAILLTLYYFA